MVRTRASGPVVGYGRSYGAGAIGTVARLARSLAPVAAQAAARYVAGRARSAVDQVVTSRNETSPTSVTTQHDVSTRYRRRRMPARKRKRWVRFTRRVRHVELQMQPLQIYQHLTKNSATAAGGTQGQAGLYLLDTNASGQGHLTSLFKTVYGLTGAITEYGPNRLYLKSACIDLQLKNTGTEQCIIDMYWCRTRANINDTSAIGSLFDAGITNMTAYGAITTTNPALTPFDNPNFCKMFKILKKTEYLISPDQVVTLQQRQAKNRYFQGRNLFYAAGALRGTFAFFFQVRGVPENTADASGLTGWSIAWSSQTTIHYAIPPGVSSETIDQTK